MTHTPTPTRLFALLLLAGLALPLAGCDMIGFATYVVKGNKVPAQYELDKNRPVLVLVEDPARHLRSPNNARIVAANVTYHLQQNEVVDTLITQDELAAFIAEVGEDQYNRMAIDEIGLAVGAELVVFVKINSVIIEVDPTVQKPMASAEVKVIDAVTGQRLWPEIQNVSYDDAPPPGRAVQTELVMRLDDTGRRASNNMVYQTLSEQMGLDIARMFYKWQSATPGDSL